MIAAMLILYGLLDLIWSGVAREIAAVRIKLYPGETDIYL